MTTPTTFTRAALAAAALSGAVLLAGCSTATASGDDSASAADAVEVAGIEISVDDAAAELLPADLAEAGVVKVATDAPYAPFEMFVEEGSEELTGVDVDLGHAIGAKLGIDVEFEQQAFDGIIPALQAGKFDATITAMTSSVERMEVLTFVDYSASGTGILTKAGNPEGIESYLDLCGQEVAVQAATSQVDLVKDVWQGECEAEGLDPIALSEFPSDADAQLAITSGKVVASLLTKPSAGYVAKTTNDGETFEVVEDSEAPNGYDATLNGIGVLKQNEDFAKAIQAALQSLMDDGTYEAILDQYGVTGIGIDEATINGAAEQ
ncbi:polar amino acid transport system substrate-binding protein [Agromyces flavus]|uniref:Amino acid ABC transporter substrate-binding protein, PAAT family n=1 Tax=Agromyces flavus TaxID=589382 RepID=A0A1H1XKY7_9MICO|nr:ABC transporter substrate-binding protein [Agromyces flavus]MCP2366446.1 polar amino acid transport system substrate-binding protein [Agromyces flavus]GGI44692.1 ABC transporter substrate-binding protein [Agromyces flavus]SDT09908.1 amino acid ABC transporter substrate-binding protein, PAAT family [Agromyces flavus]